MVLCAHGTRDPDGQRVVAELCERTAARLAPVSVVAAYVDVQEPRLGEVVSQWASGHRVVVIPLLLGTGYHIQVDVARAIAGRAEALSTGGLGPHPLLADLLCRRVEQAGAAPGDQVVLAAAGSSRDRSNDDARQMLTLVAERWRGPVGLAFAAAAAPSVPDAVQAARAHGARRIVLASYLLGRGFFHTRLGEAGADLVTEPLGSDPLVVDVIVQRYASVGREKPFI